MQTATSLTVADLIKIIDTSGRVRGMKSLVNGPETPIPQVLGVPASAAAVMLCALPAKSLTLVAADNADDAGYLYHDLVQLCGEEAVAILPSGYKRSIKYGQPDPPAQILRTEAQRRIAVHIATPAKSSLRFVVSYPEALAEGVAATADISAHTRHLKVGEEFDLTELQHWLRENSFTEADYVFEPGQFAVRGSILDIYGYGYEWPYRIDFFGDEIDSIRAFDVETQLSREKFDSIDISSRIDASQGLNLQSILNILPSETILAARDWNHVLGVMRQTAAEEISTSSLIAQEGDPNALGNLTDVSEFEKRLGDFRRFEYRASGELAPGSGSTRIVNYDCTPQGVYHKNFDMIGESLKDFLAQGYRLMILSDNPRQFERLKVIFEDRGDEIPFECVNGTLHEGFVDHHTKVCVFTDHQFFDRIHKYTYKSDHARSGKLALSLKELNQIEVGDYIVHIDHGVGRFGGLLRTEVNGKMQEMIKLVYQNNDLLFVSIHSLRKLAKYRGKEGVPPKITRLGSGSWEKIKDRTKTKLKDIARDLIKLYAARRDEKGFAFSPDSYLQQELEASFIYEDTPDQVKATVDVKADMESDRPMDRLVCGDVGFGKTEIAVRAAFKAATDNKQTAVLVPTTVLAYQHFHTFSERLKDFPVRVEYLSRARTAKETKQILADLAEGKIDIIIGTHKLIGKTVKFKDLGLLVIDEEQKFGVAVKERLKQMKVNIDTLTMSATPIPRTLQFSLMGARDLSSINTPPPNRYPIITTVTGLSDEIVTEAVNFELARNGQVFFVNHRIEGLYELEAMLRRLVPDARVIVAHGQMPPEKLEKAITDFAAHDYDILLATTIIESGIDMPNVNTIIVNNAQNFGLSELHQLRGRVGRSSRKAFCYLTVPSHIPLSPVARRRLQAIESFSDLGSGIHIAMQDLDIRGAGNLLGAEQSGFIADLGYETYQKVLREAVTELRTQEFADLDDGTQVAASTEFAADCVIESDLELLLPHHYVPQEGERIALYQELDNLEREEDLRAYEERLVDRFGHIPPETRELLQIPRLRRTARRLGIEKVTLRDGKMYTFFVGEENKAYYQSPMFGRMLNYLQQNHTQVSIRENRGRRSFLFDGIPTVSSALTTLEKILTLDAI